MRIPTSAASHLLLRFSLSLLLCPRVLLRSSALLPMAAPPKDARPRVGLVYDERMCRHATPNGEDHPENPQRIRAIWRELESAGVTQRCTVFGAKEAEDEYVAAVHTRKHVDLIRNVSSKLFDSRRKRIASRFNSIYLNEGSSESAFLAAGAVIELTEKVANGELDSGVAIVRPPGHHAEEDEAMGFCLFNNVAIAANFLLNERTDLGIKKILIVDWDVHHGNGTQKMFWNDPRVLFFSVHRHDFGCFYPAGEDGSHTMIGEGPGAGYNINVPWHHGFCGDADYLAVWDHILIPVAKSFSPDIILISGGFDAAIDDPLGGCRITPRGYSIMMKKLMTFVQGKIMMALEGGYNLNSLSKSVLACVKVLLDDKLITETVEEQPFESTWHVILRVRRELSEFWPALAADLPEKMLVGKGKLPVIEVDASFSSDSDAEINLISEEASALSEGSGISGEAYLDNVIDGVTLPLSQLKIGKDGEGTVGASNFLPHGHIVLPDQIVSNFQMWRSHLSKVDIWYGSYGSNMWKPRFLCYIKGGQVKGMKNPCRGSKDKSSPKDILWKVVPHQLFFGRASTQTWGNGGVAFLHPKRNDNAKAYMCLYRITLEQFNDVLLQENCAVQEMASPLFDLSALDFVIENKTMLLMAVKGGWYSNVLYLGHEDGIPLLTMTCMPIEIERFKSGELPLHAPSKDYMNALVKGLVEGKQLSENDAVDYIGSAKL